MPKQKTKRKLVLPAPVVAAAPPLRRVDALMVGSLLLLQLAFWWRAALLRGFLLTSDICYFFEPMKAFLHQSLRAGHLALWSPYILSGYPVGAEGQIATFYPPSLLFSWLLDGGSAVNWLLISHLMLAAVAMYVLARALGLSPFGAWLAGLVFSFSGYFFAHSQHVSLVCAAAWLPLVILFVERAWRGPLLRNAALAALCWAMAALAGHPQTLFHITLVAIFWVTWRTVQASPPTRRWEMRRPLALLALTFVLGAGVAAVQLLLTRDLSATAPHGDRGSLSYVTSFSLLGKHLFGLLSPNFQGSPAFADYRGEPYYWEYVLYVGLLPFTLALIGGASRRGRVLAGLALGALVLALATGNPLYQVLRVLPGFADFRVPARFIYVFTFAAALLAGLGWEALSHWRSLQVGRRLTLVAAAVAVVVLVDLAQFDRSFVALTDAKALAMPNPVAEVMRRDAGTWGRLVVVPPITITASWNPPNGWAVNPNGWEEARLLLASDVPQSYGLRSIYGYVGFEDETYNDFFRTSGARLYAGQTDLLSLLGVRYLYVTDQSIALHGLASTPIGPLALYRNPEAFPRAFGVGSVTRVSSRADALAETVALAQAGQLRQRAVVHGSLGSFRPVEGAVVRVTEMREPRPERALIRASADHDALLVLNERWDPGWKAYVDGRPAPLVDVDAVLMGTPLPKGEHTVEFRYEPRGLMIGLPITLVSLAACLALIVLPARRRSGQRT